MILLLKSTINLVYFSPIFLMKKVLLNLQIYYTVLSLTFISIFILVSKLLVHTVLIDKLISHFSKILRF